MICFLWPSGTSSSESESILVCFGLGAAGREAGSSNTVTGRLIAAGGGGAGAEGLGTAAAGAGADCRGQGGAGTLLARGSSSLSLDSIAVPMRGGAGAFFGLLSSATPLFPAPFVVGWGAVDEGTVIGASTCSAD